MNDRTGWGHSVLFDCSKISFLPLDKVWNGVAGLQIAGLLTGSSDQVICCKISALGIVDEDTGAVKGVKVCI